MNLIRFALKALLPQAIAFEDATKNPMKHQKKALFEYIGRNKKTEYGIKHDFANIKSIEDYQRLVPINDCISLHPYIEKMAKGIPNVLTIDKPVFFGLTSGSTNRPKLIPVTEFQRAKKAEVMNVWVYHLTKDHPDVLDGKILAIVSPESEEITESGLPCGAESGHAYKNLPQAIKHYYALPYEVFDITDFDARYYCILRVSMEQNVTTIVTLNPTTIILLCCKIDMWKDKITEDIERGTLSGDFNIPENIRKIIEKGLKPNPKRAEELKRIIKEKKKLIPKDFWPKVALIECWKGGTVKLYLKELPHYFGNVPIRDIGCLSTEARCSIPMSDEGAGGVLAIKTNFYEFIPKEDITKKDKRILFCDQLEKGKDYFLIVTTPGGLYRYNIDDIIRVLGFFNKTPIIEFMQKGLNVCSLAGEKLYESQVTEAINRAVDKNNVVVQFFSVCIGLEQPPHYIFLVEFEGTPSREEKKRLLKSIEEELRIENREYDYVRLAQLLTSPILKVVKKGGLEKYRAKKVLEGTHDGQFKAPELAHDANFEKNFEMEEEILLD